MSARRPVEVDAPMLAVEADSNEGWRWQRRGGVEGKSSSLIGDSCFKRAMELCRLPMNHSLAAGAERQIRHPWDGNGVSWQPRNGDWLRVMIKRSR